MMNDLREEKGKSIANQPNQIKRVDETSYRVKSQSSLGEYEVLNSEFGWLCSCPDSMFRGVKCKHVYAVEFSLALRNEAENRRIMPITDVSSCIYCGSFSIVKD